MSGDELAAEVYRTLGCMIVATNRTHQVGDILHETRAGIVCPVSAARMPLRVLGPASFKEAQKQFQLQDRLCPELVGTRSRWPYYYRVEAAD